MSFDTSRQSVESVVSDTMFCPYLFCNARLHARFPRGADSHPLWNDVELGTDLTTPKGDKSASEGDAAVAGATRAAVRKLGQELGIPAAQLPLKDFSFLTKV